MMVTAIRIMIAAKMKSSREPACSSLSSMEITAAVFPSPPPLSITVTSGTIMETLSTSRPAPTSIIKKRITRWIFCFLSNNPRSFLKVVINKACLYYSILFFGKIICRHTVVLQRRMVFLLYNGINHKHFLQTVKENV